VTTSRPATSPAAVERVLARYRPLFGDSLRRALTAARGATHAAPVAAPLLDEFYAQIEYHLGWRNPDLTQTRAHPGKLLRPTVLLLACELAAGRAGLDAKRRAALARRAIPAALAVELVHNFSLVHDDIEDGDADRRHRPTLWKLWGVPQAINTGDGIFALARAALWRLADDGVEARVVLRLAELLDRTCLELCEGQFLDMRNEGRRDITVPLYMAMIERKTAALMACATEMGAQLAPPDAQAVVEHLARFGRSLGLAFQLRDDLLGIWAAQELGKSPAGDLRQKKMSLPVLYALETAAPADKAALRSMYDEAGPATEEQIAVALAILERSGARERVGAALQEQAAHARAALDAAATGAPEAQEARNLFAVLLDFVASAAGA
jgi:geranylgeranyl diphosphate synthase, type I